MAEEYKSFLKTVGGNEGSRCHYSTRMDTYGKGCQHNCNYCYARSLLDFRGLWHPDDPAVADIRKIERTIKRIAEGSVKDVTLPVRLGGMTDCFMPAERKYRNTYKTINLLNLYRIPYLIVTKSDMVAEENYIRLMDRGLAHIQVSITTTDDDRSLTYERAPVTSRRIKAIEKLQEEGFDVSVRLSPFIPEYIDYGILNSIKCDKILVEFLRVNHWVEKWFDFDTSAYTLKNGGYRQLPLEAKIEYLKNIHFPEISVCEDVEEHWQYWRDHVNHNQEDCCNLKGKSDGRTKVDCVSD